MFVSLKSAVCWPSDNAGLVTDVSLLVAGNPYAVRFSHLSTLFQVSNGVPSTVHENVWTHGKYTVTARRATIAAEVILTRELSRLGVRRAPKPEAVTILATVIHEAIKEALASYKDKYEGCCDGSGCESCSHEIAFAMEDAYNVPPVVLTHEQMSLVGAGESVQFTTDPEDLPVRF